MNPRIRTGLCAALVLAALPFPRPRIRPPWAPAHGWRKKNDPHYVGYTGRKWEKDYGVLNGRCNTQAVAAVLGGAAGGVIGAQVGKGDARTVAIIAGAALGAVLGAKIGREIDARDQGCVGHALELAGERHTVAWTNAATGVTYRLTPTANLKRGNEPCREFITETSEGKKKDRAKGVACRTGEGVWQMVNS